MLELVSAGAGCSMNIDIHTCLMEAKFKHTLPLVYVVGCMLVHPNVWLPY